MIQPIASQQSLSTITKNGIILNIPARRMWGWIEDKHGYCGETSFQMAGLYYGQWVSSEIVRYADGNKELLIGVNDVKAAQNLNLTYEVYNKKGDFIDWINKYIISGIPVIHGFYEILPDKDDGDDDYDHIMPIVGITQNKKTIYFHDLAIYNVRSMNTNILTRKNAVDENIDEIKDEKDLNYTLSTSKNAIVITGIVDLKKETKRIMVTTSIQTEPDWGEEDELNQAPTNITFSLHIYSLTVGKKYSILRFDSLKILPKSDFLTGKWSKRTDFIANNINASFPNYDTLMSNGEYYWRCVETK
jgi:hypothetical protein